MMTSKNHGNRDNGNSRTAIGSSAINVRDFNNTLKEFTCGWGASFVNITVTYPIYKVMFRQMLHGATISSAVLELQREGYAYLYRGILPPLAQKTISLSLMFGVYDGVRRPMIDAGINPYLTKTVAGLIAGSVEAILMPFERIQTLLADSAYHNRFQNTSQAFKYVWVNYGYRELFRGLTPILLRNGPSNSLFFLLREEAAVRLPVHTDTYRQRTQEFLSGAIIGAFLSSLFYPINVVKVEMQRDMGHASMSIRQAFLHVYAERNYQLRLVFKGVGVNCSRAFLSWGIINASYEYMKNLLY